LNICGALYVTPTNKTSSVTTERKLAALCYIASHEKLILYTVTSLGFVFYSNKEYISTN